MILGSMIRFAARGWIDELYVQPVFFFKYYGFSWVHPFGAYTWLLFLLCGISALCFTLGLFYRLSATLLFLSFTYIELMDKTNYLNHYYFVSLVLFLMIWLPGHANAAVDNKRYPATLHRFVPLWTVGSIRLLLSLVYFYAGLAKLNSDWLLNAMPLRLWLPARNDLPVIGPWFNELWVAYAFSWFGCLYDLTVPFFLLYRRTRPYAYIVVIVFHITTSVLFPIGMFPYVMIVSTLIFFDSKSTDRLLLRLRSSSPSLPVSEDSRSYQLSPAFRRPLGLLLVAFFSIQLLFPWRYLLYPGELFWTEEGYRFSWRVMLIEKMGYAQFVVQEANGGRRTGVNNNDHLTKNQEKMMATQPDFIIQYAQHLRQFYKAQGWKYPRIYATVHVTLNGRRSTLLIDPATDLATQTDSYRPKKWILPFNDTIHGL